ncbi:arylsulfatase B [Fopius arisanus]|uniref:Arylsulfatase B n=1 Tax=Fopius arisanus TaxID=64838 RepID=A0A9R1U237_9HYME|nr:PREDICTED: arylsulfatase B-like [Fopius arisanus]
MESLFFKKFTLGISIYYAIYSVSAVQSNNPGNSPNIIVIIADDLGWNDVSFHGSNEIPTPNIDSLAYNGLILRNHYVLPTCTPSRTAFLTGRYPIREGMQGYPLLAGEPRGIPLTTKLLPEHLRNLGYSTRLVGKWHVGYSSDELTPAKRGFDTFFGYYNGFIDYYRHNATTIFGVTGYDFHRDNPKELKPDWARTGEYATDIFTDEAVKIIEEHDIHRPLYLQLSHLAPHSSDVEDPSLEVRNFTALKQAFHYIENVKRLTYAGMVTAVDESVGRVVEALNRKNILANSIIIFLADNGAPTFGEHENYGSNYPLRGIKSSFYEGGVHGAACVYSSLIKNPGRIVDDLVHMADWLPTLYAAAGGNDQDLGVIDGVNQWPTIERGEPGSRKSLLINIDEKVDREAAIIGRYKLLKKGAMPHYDGYYGNNIDDEDSSAPAYDLNAIMSSSTSQAILETTGVLANSSIILDLRARGRIICEPFTKFANCSETCLFDLEIDPCETTNISNRFPDMVEMLENFIAGYRNVLMNQTNAPVDPKSYPECHNGVWMPWLDAEDDIMGKLSI